MDTQHNNRKSLRLQDVVTSTQAKTPPNANKTYSDITATKYAESDATNLIGNNDVSKATSTYFYVSLVNDTNAPSPRSRKAPASRALSRNNKVIYTTKIRLPDTNDIMKSMQCALKEWFKVMKDVFP